MPLLTQLESEGEPPDFVRAALGALEAELRQWALLALGEWDALGVSEPALYGPVEAAQRPSWGSWHGLLRALSKARARRLPELSGDEQAKLERATPAVGAWAAIERERVSREAVSTLKALGALSRQSLKRLDLGRALALPISLRNRVAHDPPDDPAWWAEAAAALKPLIALIDERDLAATWAAAKPREPWLREGGATAFNGLTHDLGAVYVTATGETRTVDAPRDLLLALRRLRGQAEVQEEEFRRLLSEQEDLAHGVLLGDFLVGAPVGAGGFGTVYRGRQLSTGRRVGIKILHEGLPEDASARFRQEGEVLAALDHPHVIGVLGSGQATWAAPAESAAALADEEWFTAWQAGAPTKTYLALEWIEGRTLDEWIVDPERPALDRIHGWLEQVAGALAAIHARGWLHRDVTPRNVMIRADGRAILLDLGLARSRSEERTLVTTAGRALGTPAYLAPEQLRALDGEAEVGPRADLYGLSATFYELYTGQRLFEHDRRTAQAVSADKLAGLRPRPPRRLTGGLPWALQALLLGGLEPVPADRPATARAFQADVRRLRADEPITYRRPSLWRRGVLGYRRNRRLVNLALALILLLAGGFLYSVLDLQSQIVATAGEQSAAQQGQRLAKLRQSLAELRGQRAQRDEVATETRRKEAVRLEDKAQTRAEASRLRLAESYQEQGRVEAIAGHPWRALAYLAEARGRRSEPDPALDHLLNLLGAQPFPTDLVAHAGQAMGAVFDPRGERLLTWGRGRDDVRVWDVESGSQLGAFPSGGLVGTIEAALFMPDGEQVVLGSPLHVWEVASRTHVAELEQGGVPLAISPDGEWIAFRPRDYSETEQVGWWSPRSGATRRSATACASTPRQVCFGPQGGVAALCDEEARVWDLTSGAELARYEGTGLSSLAWIDSDTLLLGDEDGMLRAFGIASGEVQWEVEHAAAVSHVTALPEGRLASVSADWNGSEVRLLRRDTGDLLGLHTLGNSSGVAIAPLTSLFAVRRHEGVELRELGSGRLRATLPSEGWGGVSFDPSERRVATRPGNNGEAGQPCVQLWDAQVETRLPPRVEFSESLSGATLTVSPNGETVLLTTPGPTMFSEGGTPTLQTFASDDLRPLERVVLPGGCSGQPVFDATGSHLLLIERGAPTDDTMATVAFLSRLEVRSTATLARELLLAPGGEKIPVVEGAAGSRDGRWIVTAATDDRLRLWDAHSGELVTTRWASGVALDLGEAGWCGVDEQGRLLTLSRPGSSSDEGSSALSVWASVAAMSSEAPLRWHLGPGRVIQVETGGDAVFTRKEDGRAALWDVRSGQLVRDLTPAGERIESASRVGGTLVLVDGDGRVQVWDLAADRLVSTFAAAAQSAHLLADGVRLLALRSGSYAIHDVRSGRLLSEHELPERLMTYARAGDRLILAFEHSLVSVDLRLKAVGASLDPLLSRVPFLITADGQLLPRGQLETPVASGEDGGPERAPLAALEDSLEPNDQPEQARLLEPGTYEGLTLQDPEVDWYRVRIPAGQRLLCEIQGEGVRGRFFLADGRALGWRPDGLWLRSREPAVAFLQLGPGILDDEPRDYSLQVELAPTTFADRYEPNDHLAQAAAISSGTHADLVGQGYDCYRIRVPPGCALSAVAAVDSGALPRLVVHEGDVWHENVRWQEGATSIQALPAVEEVVLRVEAAGPYRLDLSMPPYRAPDPLEPNDLAERPRTIEPGRYSALVLNGEDHYRLVGLPEGKQVVARVQLRGAEGGVEVRLGRGKAQSGETLEVTAEVPPSGELALDLLGWAERYDLALEVRDPEQADRFEPNDERWDAAELSAGVHSGLVLSNEDWYRVQVEAGQELRVRAKVVSVLPRRLGFSLSTTGPVSTQTQWVSIESGESGLARVHARQAGEVLLRVSGEAGQGYDLTLELGSFRPADAFEPNGTREEAKDLPAGDHPALVLDGDDWYRVVLAADEALHLEVTEGRVWGIEVFDSEGLQLRATEEQRLTYLPPKPGALYLHLSGGSAGGPLPYALRCSLVAWEPADPLEPNDDPARARPLGLGLHEGLVLQDEDWYQVSLAGGQELLVELDDAAAPDELVLDVRGSGEWASYGLAGRGGLRIYAATDSALELHVHSERAQGKAYSLTLTERARALGDHLEPNDTASQIAVLSSGVHAGLQLEFGDRYQLQVPEGQVLRVALRRPPTEGRVPALQMRLSRPDAWFALQDGHADAAGVWRLTFRPPRSGPYVLRVMGEPQPYELEVELVPWVAADRHEPNDESDQASRLELGEHRELVVQQEDWYRVEVPEGSELRVVARGETPLELILERSSDPLVSCEAAPVASVTWVADRAALVDVCVRGEQGGRYSLELSAPDYQALDAHEPNDDYRSARPLEAGLHPDLVLQSDDYYWVDVPEGRSLELDVEREAGQPPLELLLMDGDTFFELHDTIVTGERYRVRFCPPQAGALCLSLRGPRQAYALRVAHGDPIQADRYEPNDTQRFATRIEPGDHTGLRSNGSDWYVVRVGRGQRLRARVSYTEGGRGRLALHARPGQRTSYLYPRYYFEDPLLAFAPAPAAEASVEWVARSTDDHLLRVLGEGEYRLELQVEDP